MVRAAMVVAACCQTRLSLGFDESHDAGSLHLRVDERVQEIHAGAPRYRWAAQLLHHLVLAQPDNDATRFLQADAFEQLGYQTEAVTWRNIYFVGAHELRNGPPKAVPDIAGSEDMIRSMPLDMAFDYLAIQLDSASRAM
jgi:alkyl sulfatase BDS1-like metallo-beta-lactamase superfamily hydrolase